MKDRQVKFLCSKDQYIRIVHKADFYGFATISEYMRFVALNEDLIRRIVKEVIRELKNDQ